MAKGTPAWDQDYIWKAYALAMQGYDDLKIANAYGIAPGTWYQWRRNHPALKAAVQAGQAAAGGVGAKLPDYLFARLSPANQQLWQDIQDHWQTPDGHIVIEQAFNGMGQYKAQSKARQHLFLYALTRTTFSVSKAMHMVNLSKDVLDSWLADSEFIALWKELEFHRKNFMEDQLLRLVQEGYPAAVLHVNKTLNADRGYGDKLQVTGKVDHTHKHMVVDLAKLNLAPEVMDAVVLAMLQADGIGEDGLVVEQASVQVGNLLGGK